VLIQRHFKVVPTYIEISKFNGEFHMGVHIKINSILESKPAQAHTFRDFRSIEAVHRHSASVCLFVSSRRRKAPPVKRGRTTGLSLKSIIIESLLNSV
jgi:hypothetical protein